MLCKYRFDIHKWEKTKSVSLKFLEIPIFGPQHNRSNSLIIEKKAILMISSYKRIY